jgi:hypothetical protein
MKKSRNGNTFAQHARRELDQRFPKASQEGFRGTFTFVCQTCIRKRRRETAAIAVRPGCRQLLVDHGGGIGFQYAQTHALLASLILCGF